MSKKLYVLTAVALAALVVIFAFSFPTKKSEPQKPDTEAIVKKFGFTSTKNLNEENIKRYAEHGFVVYSDQSFLDTMRTHNLAVVNSEEYLGTIPEEKLLEMKATYDKLSDYDNDFEYVYNFTLYNQFSRETRCGDELNELIHIAAPKDQVSTDPIVIIKIKGGWVQLARW
jgi:hypothetical protein